MHGSRWRREETRPVGPVRAARSGASRRPYRDRRQISWLPRFGGLARVLVLVQSGRVSDAAGKVRGRRARHTEPHHATGAGTRANGRGPGRKPGTWPVPEVKDERRLPTKARGSVPDASRRERRSGHSPGQPQIRRTAGRQPGQRQDLRPGRLLRQRRHGARHRPDRDRSQERALPHLSQGNPPRIAPSGCGSSAWAARRSG